MKKKSTTFTKKAINNPEETHKSPESVLWDSRLTPREKDKALSNWEQDQQALLRAEDESMTQKNDTAPTATLLQRVKNTEAKLETTMPGITKNS